MIELAYDQGTLELTGVAQDQGREVLGGGVDGAWRWDARTQTFRAPAIEYRNVVTHLTKRHVEFEDRARDYGDIELTLAIDRTSRGYQREALDAWSFLGRGVVVLPTGAGKTHVAMLAIYLKKRPTLVVAPTLDLVRQWYDQLRIFFDTEVGVLGGGSHDVRPITVSTYDSAHIYAAQIGSKFGLLVFDECHHLPTESYGQIAKMSLAPYRLGLSATPDRADGKHTELSQLIGPIVYEKDITELAGEFLAEYSVELLSVALDDKELEDYEFHRGRYRDFLRSHRIIMKGPEGFSNFIREASRSREGNEALKSYRLQRLIAMQAKAKVECVERLLFLHKHDRTIIFTNDNDTAYEVSKKFLVPAITHRTSVRERSWILSALASAEVNAVATSRVLNEGVDVPDVNVAIVMSGTGSVREHVQRLGRILRKKEGKRAILYELITANTAEMQTSERRRDHIAYR